MKNTFLDDVLEDSSPESNHGVHLERSTCPNFSRRREAEANSFEAPQELLEPIRAPWPSEMTTMDSFNGPNPCADRMSWSSIASGYEPDMPIKVISRDVPAVQQPKQPMKGVLPPPSIGSQRHGRGACTPCPFFWKPSGCVEGRACNFCHLCPEPQQTVMKQTVMDVCRPTNGSAVPVSVEAPNPLSMSLSGGYAKYVGGTSDAGASTAPEDHQKVLEMQQKLCPAIFEDHATGNCKPCTFFWKPEGCRKSEGCHHCHLCPPSALKDRKLQKVMARRQEKAGKSSSKSETKEKAIPSTAPMPAGLIYF